jgi:hypothetical protein
MKPIKVGLFGLGTVGTGVVWKDIGKIWKVKWDPRF